MLTSTVSRSADHGEALAERVRVAAVRGEALRIVGGDTKAFYGRSAAGAPLELAGHTGVIAYEPSELVITARAGTPIAEIEALLDGNHQMLAFEPPIFGAASTLGGVVASGLSGPRRPFVGAVRDYVLGVTLLDGRGRVLRFGGTVFKNVAGFDGFRLMAGALGCLGALLEISVRVAPKPRAEAYLSYDIPWPEAQNRLTTWLRRPLPISGAMHDGTRLRLRLSGADAAVGAAARDLGGEAEAGAVWDDLRHMRLGPLTGARLWRLSVPRLANTDSLPGVAIRDWAGAQIWLTGDTPAGSARDVATAAGGHATLFRGAATEEAVFTALPAPLLALHQRLKAAFDPAGVFNPGRMYENL